MATPTTPHTTTTGPEEARAALAAALRGDAAPAPTPPPTPEPTPTPQAAPPEPPAPTPTPTPDPALAPSGTPAPAGQSPAYSDPAARRFLEMNGGDVERALARALGFNNRLSALHETNPELFRSGAVADPHGAPTPGEPRLFEEPPPVTPSLEPPQVVLDPNEIQAHVTQAVHQDQQSTAYIREWSSNNTQLEKLGTERTDLMSRIAYNEHKLKDPDFAPDDLRRGPVENEIARLQNQLGLIEARESRLQMQQERLAARFDQRQAQIRQYIEGVLFQQAESEAFTAHEENLATAEFHRVQREWPSAIERCIRENNIPPEQVEDFKADAVRAFEAAMGRDADLVIGDMYTFLSPVAKSLVQRLDRYHRVRAGQYGGAAAARAAAPSPVTGPGTPAPPEPSKNTTPEEAIAEATRYMRQRLGR